MANRFVGKMGKGAARKVREQKRQEAELRVKLAKALDDAGRGNVADLGDFTQYAEEDA